MKMIMEKQITKKIINRPSSRHRDKYTKYVSRYYNVNLPQYILHKMSKTGATFEARFIKKLSNTETELSKRVAYKKRVRHYDIPVQNYSKVDWSGVNMQFGISNTYGRRSSEKDVVGKPIKKMARIVLCGEIRKRK